jgi:hypothetical protein
MTLTATTILLYLAALFLTVATIWPFSYATQTISPKQTDPRDFLVLIGVVLPFVMLIYFGSTFLISDTIILLREPDCGGYLCRFIGVAMVALAQSDRAHRNTRPCNNCGRDYPSDCWCYLGRTPRPNVLNGFALRQTNKNPRKLIRGFLPVFSETVRWLLNGVSVNRAIVSPHHAPPAFKDRPTVLCGLCGSRVATLKRAFCNWHLPFPCLPVGLHRHRLPTNSQISKMTTISIPIWSMVFIAAC